VRVELHPEADEEFAAQVEFFEGRQAGVGQRFYHEVIACLDWIAANPTLPRQRKGHRRVNLKVFPFYIAYVIEQDLIWILAVARGSRKPRYWLSRSKPG
jgi:hypothetical protein